MEENAPLLFRTSSLWCSETQIDWVSLIFHHLPLVCVILEILASLLFLERTICVQMKDFAQSVSSPSTAFLPCIEHGQFDHYLQIFDHLSFLNEFFSDHVLPPQPASSATLLYHFTFYSFILIASITFTAININLLTSLVFYYLFLFLLFTGIFQLCRIVSQHNEYSGYIW
jgi:hypothetical protein